MIDSCPDFWSFPFECRFETEDSRIATLEKFAEEAAPGAWQSQYANSTEISFRFPTEVQRAIFILSVYCRTE
jgi:hypothetical protein